MKTTQVGLLLMLALAIPALCMVPAQAAQQMEDHPFAGHKDLSEISEVCIEVCLRESVTYLDTHPTDHGIVLASWTVQYGQNEALEVATLLSGKPISGAGPPKRRS